jgi:hypothetical protein
VDVSVSRTQWEPVSGDDLYNTKSIVSRISVPSGWLYRVANYDENPQVHIVFVPSPAKKAGK